MLLLSWQFTHPIAESHNPNLLHECFRKSGALKPRPNARFGVRLFPLCSCFVRRRVYPVANALL